MSIKPAAVPPIVQHILSHLPSPPPSQTRATPLFVAIQGPQGSGKTFLTEHVASSLSQDAELRVATLSIDDLYLPHDGLAALATSHPNNPLLRGRGQPGTHDIRLGIRTLKALKNINDAVSTPSLKLPSFDKSQFNGEGDRVPEAEWRSIDGPIDVVLFEGWCVGFCPKSEDEIRKRIGEKIKGLQEGPLRLDLREVGVGEEQVLEVNEILAEYVEWWKMFDIFVKVRCLLLQCRATQTMLHLLSCRSHPLTPIHTSTFISGACSRNTP